MKKSVNHNDFVGTVFSGSPCASPDFLSRLSGTSCETKEELTLRDTEGTLSFTEKKSLR